MLYCSLGTGSFWVSLWGREGGWCWWVNWYLCRYVQLVYVVVQFCPWFKFYFPLFLGMVIYDNEFETKKNRIWTKENRIKLNNNMYIWFIAKIFSNVMTDFNFLTLISFSGKRRSSKITHREKKKKHLGKFGTILNWSSNQHFSDRFLSRK